MRIDLSPELKCNDATLLHVQWEVQLNTTKEITSAARSASPTAWSSFLESIPMAQGPLAATSLMTAKTFSMGVNQRAFGLSMMAASYLMNGPFDTMEALAQSAFELAKETIPQLSDNDEFWACFQTLANSGQAWITSLQKQGHHEESLDLAAVVIPEIQTVWHNPRTASEPGAGIQVIHSIRDALYGMQIGVLESCLELHQMEAAKQALEQIREEELNPVLATTLRSARMRYERLRGSAMTDSTPGLEDALALMRDFIEAVRDRS